jgi:PAS domain S-box-containing protein
MLITGHDITERNRAERELRASEARLSGILRISPEAVIVTDAAQNIKLFNEGAERIFGHTAAEAMGKPIDILIPSALREKHRKHVKRFQESGETSRFMSARQEISALAKGGVIFPAEASISKLELHGETVFTVLLHDITERKKAERMLLAAKETAESANRAKSEFLANMSHELRTPLNAILGFSEVIRSEVLGPVGVDRYVEYAEDIHRSGEHLLEIISDILDVATIDAGHASLDEEIVSVVELARSCLVLFRERAAAAGLDLAVEIPSDLPPIYCDARKMKQLIVNLLSNAVKFTEPGGHVSVAAFIDDRSGDAVIEVSDDGIGIPSEDIPRVMEPFTQIESPLTRQREGTGLGLPLVKKLIELHGGTIELESAHAKGTRAIVRVPAHRVASDGSRISLIGGGE